MVVSQTLFFFLDLLNLLSDEKCFFLVTEQGVQAPAAAPDLLADSNYKR